MTTKRAALICGVCLASCLSPAAGRAQQDEPPRPRAPTWASLLAVGAYEQRLFPDSGGGENWSGFMVEGSFKPAGGGPWLASVTSFIRPEGNGAVLAAGKYLELGWGYAYLGGATGWGPNEQYLPLVQGTGDLDVAVGNSGLVLGGGAVVTNVKDGHTDVLGQVGPTLYALGSVFTCRFLLNDSNPGSNLSYGVLATARHGTSDREPWQSVTVTAGTEAYQIATNAPTATSNAPGTSVQTNVHNAGVHVTADVFQPLTQRHALRLTVDWGRKFDSYYLFGGTLRWVLLF